MENLLNGVYNFLSFINDNWTIIAGIIAILFVIGMKIKNFLSKSKEEQIAIAKRQARETILALVAKAQEEYYEWVSAGSIKRSQVVTQIFEMYPILSTITNQEEVIEWIYEEIDNALDSVRKIFEENEAAQAGVTSLKQ